jgi:predicted enzyme related to lactoylglutathione lyase
MELTNAINWFEISANNFDRAKKFYETIFDYQMQETTTDAGRMEFFYTIIKQEKLAAHYAAVKIIFLLKMDH